MANTSNLHFLVFGGGGKVALEFARVVTKEGHQVTSVVRNDSHDEAIKSAGATPLLLDFVSASVKEISDVLVEKKPDVVIFSAGAGGQAAEELIRKVDYEGAVKVFDACESSNTHRIIIVSCIDLRSKEEEYPEYYNEASKGLSVGLYKALPNYVQYKFKADKELRARKALQFGIVRPGWLTDEPASGVQVGKVQLGSVSRESVARLILAMAQNPASHGLTLDIMDGEEKDVGKALEGAVESGADTWRD